MDGRRGKCSCGCRREARREMQPARNPNRNQAAERRRRRRRKRKETRENSSCKERRRDWTGLSKARANDSFPLFPCPAPRRNYQDKDPPRNPAISSAPFASSSIHESSLRSIATERLAKQSIVRACKRARARGHGNWRERLIPRFCNINPAGRLFEYPSLRRGGENERTFKIAL